MTLRIVAKAIMASCMLWTGSFAYGNQTEDTTPILPQTSLPFNIAVREASFSLPSGLQSFVSANYKGNWVLLAGRTNGLHDFSNTTNNFPPGFQNTTVFVVNPVEGVVWTKSLTDPSSGLSQEQLDLLSVTNAEEFLHGDTLYVVGGYGVDTATSLFSTKTTLMGINIPGLIHWVKNPSPNETAAQHIIFGDNTFCQVTGGVLFQPDPHAPLQLVFGQNFDGFYFDGSNGEYTKQVRRFNILNVHNQLYLLPQPSADPQEYYRRRDLNVVPIIRKSSTTLDQELVALSGVFTEDGGIWTVPVQITRNGSPSMADPTNPDTFKQGMNNYDCATLGMFSHATNDMFIVLFGGISYGYFEDDTFMTDPEIPFINQITTIKIDEEGVFSQYIMDNEYPVIPSTGSNPGNPLLFGAEARFFPAKGMPKFPNGVLILDQLGTEPVVLGYIVGGIMSTLPNTVVFTDSTSSPYIFEVILNPELP